MTYVVTTEAGTVTVPDAVLAGIAARAAETVPGIRVRKRRTVDLDARVVKLAVVARRGEPLLELAERAQEEAVAMLKAMCGLEARVDLAIGELE